MYIQLPELDYYPPGDFSYPTFSFYGPAHLGFTSATSGTVAYDTYNALHPGPAPAIAFSNYTASMSNPNSLHVSLTITVQDCIIPINAIFHHA
jgi:hypothetical protein